MTGDELPAQTHQTDQSQSTANSRFHRFTGDRLKLELTLPTAKAGELYSEYWWGFL